MEVTSPARPGQCDAQRRRTRLYYCIEASRGLLFYLFIYPPEFFCSNFWLSGRMPPTLQFSVVWESASYSGVRFSGSYYHAVYLLFLLLLPTIGVASRSISVGLIEHYQLARISRDDCHSTRYCRLFRDIPGMQCLLVIYPSRIVRERGGDAARAPKLRLLIYFSQRLHFPSVRASGSVGRHASRFYWLRPCTFTSVGVITVSKS
jgi:hypothetical protein